MTKPRFPVGLKFKLKRGKTNFVVEWTIDDILTTTNNKNEVVRIEYLCSHFFLCNRVTERIIDTTIARALPADELAKYVEGG